MLKLSVVVMRPMGPPISLAAEDPAATGLESILHGSVAALMVQGKALLFR